jgi:hypothetical protein
VHNVQIYKQGSTIRVRVLPSKIFFPTSRLTRKVKKITTNKLHTRTKFLHFLNQVPHSSFKKLIVSTPIAGMAERQKEWQNGRMAEMDTYVLFMVHADTDDTDDNDDNT